MEKLDTLTAEEDVRELTSTVKKKLLSTPNPKRTAQTLLFKDQLMSVKQAKQMLLQGPTAVQLCLLLWASVHHHMCVLKPLHGARN